MTQLYVKTRTVFSCAGLMLLPFCYIAYIGILLVIRPLTDNVPRSLLYLHIYLSDILTDNADGDKLYSAQKADDADSRSPAAGSVSEKSLNDSPYHSYEAYGSYHHAESEDKLYRLYRKARNAVKGKSQHLA